MRKIVTLTTDFGLSDSFVGIMKGVMLSIDPDIIFVDITHEIPPQDIIAGAICLHSIRESFPQGTVHLAVVDPGVGTERNPVIVKTERYFYVGPDNGIFTLISPEIKKVVKISKSEFVARNPSATFHGRDIFAPVAARLFSTPIEKFGESLDGVSMLPIPLPGIKGGVIEGEIIYVDRFGNLFTNITSEYLLNPFPDSVSVKREILIGSTKIETLSASYSEGGEGALAAIINSFGYMEIYIKNGNAKSKYGYGKGERVSVRTV